MFAWSKVLESSDYSRHIELYAGLDGNWRSWPDGDVRRNTSPLINSFRKAMMARGARGIYFFNYLEYQEEVLQSVFDDRLDVPVTYFDFPVSRFQDIQLPLWVLRKAELPLPNLKGVFDDGEGIVRVKLNREIFFDTNLISISGTRCEYSKQTLDEVEFKCPNIRDAPFTMLVNFPVRVEAVEYSSYSRL